MKLLQKAFAVWTISILLLSGAIIVNVKASVCDGVLNLPNEPVTMTVYDNQIISYFDTYLSNVSPGYDVTNGGPYLGWCAQPGNHIERGVGHQVMLYSSYDPAMPTSFWDEDWDKINYVLNHKIGTEDDISIAIWYFLDCWSYGIPTNSQTMIDEANMQGEGYLPPCDGVIVVLADGGSGIQRTIFELSIIYLETPTVSTQLVPDTINLGESCYDTVTVTGSGDTPTGTVQFQISTDMSSWDNFGALVALVDGYAESGTFTPSAAGTYYFRAIYYGDSNYYGAQSADDDEPLTVNEMPEPCCRWTGGGTIGLCRKPRVTHGFELHANVSHLPNNLEVNWDGNHFHLDVLTYAECWDDPNINPKPPSAGCDTIYGRGDGKYNGVSGYHVEFTFTDAGEPGRRDYASITITDSTGVQVMHVDGNLRSGNQQVHRCTGNDA